MDAPSGFRRGDDLRRPQWHEHHSAAVGTDNELKLFRKIPDIEHFADFHQASDTHVVVTIRQIGEMEPNNPGSTVDLSGGSDELGEASGCARMERFSKSG